MVVSAKTFVFTSTFWANGNFNLPGVPSDTDDVVIHQRLYIINNHVDAVCRDLILTEDNLVLQKSSSLTVHGETTLSASLTKAEIDVAENATVSFLWKTLSDTVKYGSSIGFNDEVKHLYPGTYKVSVLNHPSCGTITETFEISEPDSLVEVNFKPNRTSAKLNKGAEFIFTNHSFGAKKYTWSFGDGDSLTQSFNATHTYLSLGNFIVKLIAERDQCTKTNSAFIEVIDDTFVENLEAYEGLTVKAVSTNTLMINSIKSFKGSWQLNDLRGRLVQQGEIRLSPNTPEYFVFNNLTGV